MLLLWAASALTKASTKNYHHCIKLWFLINDCTPSHFLVELDFWPGGSFARSHNDPDLALAIMKFINWLSRHNIAYLPHTLWVVSNPQSSLSAFDVIGILKSNWTILGAVCERNERELFLRPQVFEENNVRHTIRKLSNIIQVVCYKNEFSVTFKWVI